MKKYLLLLPLLFCTFATMSGAVSAAEITPDADSYSLGSTSEMSASSTYDIEPPEDSLADTGTNPTLIIIAAVSLLAVGAIVTRRTIKT